ncbi:MAG TPA: family 43 glycosylhydrolase [Lacipirellulaceae bacterium]|jgi:arabinan endo-1,5-alpha-L-arabinosidase
MRGQRVAGAMLVVLASLCARTGHTQTVTGTLSIHDPSTVVHVGGKYYDFYTGTGILSKTSTDRVNWSNGPAVFATAPSWISTAVPANTNRDYWAPDIAYFNNQYYLYYSVSTFGKQVSAIGLATNPTLDSTSPNYHWTDQGPVIQSHAGSAYNTIDPSIIQDSDGSLWMTFGSFWSGIYAAQLDSTTGKRSTTSPPAPVLLAQNPQNPPDAIEASYVYKHDNYYYLFANWGNCCQGVSSTYNIRVGRSASIDGPFLDQNGVNMANGGGTLFLGTDGKYIGPGQIGIFHDAGVDWFSYHYYDGTANGAPTFNLRTLLWNSADWPVPGPSFLTPGDVNLDGIVDAADFNVISDHLFQTGASRTDGDLNGDGVVNYADFHFWKRFDSGGAGSFSLNGAVPEPASGRLLVAGTLTFLMYWRVSTHRRLAMAT